MKKCIFLVLILSAFGIANAQQRIVLQAENDGLRIENNNGLTFSAGFSFTEISVQQVSTPEGMFADISAPDFAFRFNDGNPSIPVFSKLIEIPGQTEVVIRVKSYTTQLINLPDYGIYDRIFPAQPSYSKSTDPEDIHFIFNEAAYLINDFTQGSLVSIEYQGMGRGVGIGQLIIDPIRYNPVKNQLLIYNNIQFEVEFITDNYSEYLQEKDRVYSPMFNSTYNKLPNYIPASTRDLIAEYPIKYVIVADPMFEDSLQKFIHWKTQKGFNVIEAYTDDPAVGTSTTSIKTYLQNLYNAGSTGDPAPTFVLIVGDIAQIPAFASTITGYNHPSDMYYGEYTGSGDFIPELYIGRFSATNVNELMPQINKTLQYEKFTMPTSLYMDTCVLVAGYDNTGYDASHGNPQINYATNNYFNAAHGFFSWTYLDPNNTEIIAGDSMRSKLYRGMGFANYTAHCDWDRWGTPSFTTTNVASMYNANKYGLMIGNCCLSNKFNATGGPCLGEVLLRTPNKGAVGYIGGSNNTLWNEDYWWGIGVTSTIQSSPTYATTGLGAYDCVFHDHGEPYADWFVTNSQVVYAGNSAVQASTSTQKKYYWEIYHLMGDPSVMNYMSQPPALSMSYTTPIMVGDMSLVVTCEPYTLVAISQNNVLLDSEFSGPNSSVTLNFPAFTAPGTALIVGTKQDRSPHIQSIDIEELSIPIDAQVMEIQNIETSYPCDGVEIAPVLVIRNKGINNLTQVTINYKWDSGTTQQINWTGNLVTNATDQVTLPNYMLTTGNHTLKAWTSNPNGMTDGNMANDSSDVVFTVEDLPIVADFAANITEFCSAPAEVSFTNSCSNANTFSWDFGDGTNSTDANPVHQYTDLGLYTVTLIADAGVCGSDTKVYTDLILVGAEAPVANDQESCTPTAFTLNATGSGTISWYDDAAGTNLVGTGTSYTTPTLSSTTSYWLSTSIQELVFGAKPDNTGTGGYFTTAGYPHGLIFDCTSPVVLKSVKVYSSQAGNRLITLEDSQGGVLQSVTINIPNGESRITLNFNIPVGTDMQLMGPGAPYLYRNGGTGAPDLPYPYYVGDAITITYNTADAYAYYYYFYDWEIESVCESSLNEVTAYILSTPVASFSMSNAGNTVTFTNTSTGGNLSYSWDFGDGNFSTEENPVHSYAANGLYTITLTVTNSCGSIMYQDQIDLTLTSINEDHVQVVVYPNPAETYCRIQCGEVMKSIELTDIQGKLIQRLMPDTDIITLDLQGIAQGIYNIRIVTEKETIVKQIQVK